MNLIEFSAILFVFAYAAGVLGVLTGLGGGIIITPMLVLLFSIDMRVAMGASLISVIATSSGSAMSFIRGKYTNIRLAMFLESGAAVGAVAGAIILPFVSLKLISITFGCILIFATWFNLRNLHDRVRHEASHPLAVRLHLTGEQLTAQGMQSYKVYKVPLGLFLMTLAGVLSGLLGIGSGSFKVLALDMAMGLPYKVATSTSNFMLGMTATASAGIYFAAGYINPSIAFPVLLGVLCGAWSGVRLFEKAKPHTLRTIFSIIVFILGLQMIYNGAVHLK